MCEFSSRRRSPRGPPLAARLLALASTTSALSLASFQIITSNSIPSPCILAYNTQIVGCSTSDFTNGNQCSTLCINGLLEESSLVQAICGGLSVNSQSLLGLTLDGQLLNTLCPGSNVGTTTVKVTVQPSTSSNAASTTTTLDQTSTTTSSSIILTTTTIPSSSAATTSSPIVNAPSPTSSTTQTSVATTTVISQTTQATSQTTQATSTTTGTTATTQAAATKGGGSPFDPAVQNQATVSTRFRLSERLLVVFSIAVLLLR